MAPWVKSGGRQVMTWVNSHSLHNGEGEPTPQSCPLTSTPMPWQAVPRHMPHTAYVHPAIINEKFKAELQKSKAEILETDKS